MGRDRGTNRGRSRERAGGFARRRILAQAGRNRARADAFSAAGRSSQGEAGARISTSRPKCRLVLAGIKLEVSAMSFLSRPKQDTDLPERLINSPLLRVVVFDPWFRAAVISVVVVLVF